MILKLQLSGMFLSLLSTPCQRIHIKDADSIINKYIITENTRVSKKKTAHTWRQEMRYIQSGVNLERSSSPHNGSSKSKTNQSDSRLSSGETSYFELF